MYAHYINMEREISVLVLYSVFPTKGEGWYIATLWNF